MSTAYEAVYEVVEALSIATPQIIKMPTEQEIINNASEFAKYGYPNVLGAIDGTAISVTVPASNKLDFFTRKYTTAINLTAVCNARKEFLAITVGFSEKCHDSHIFQCSTIGKTVMSGSIPRQYHLLGDAAYGQHVNVISPYPGENLSAAKTLHNNKHSSTRMAIERSFSDLKRRFLRLKHLSCDLSYANMIVAACCVLHNICVRNRDIDHNIQRYDNGNVILQFTNAETKRDAITRHLFVPTV